VEVEGFGMLRRLTTRKRYGHISGMALLTVTSTYSLDLETIGLLERVAERWRVSKSEALRRTVRTAATETAADAGDALDALHALQGSRRLTIEHLRQTFTHTEISYTIDPCLLAQDLPYPILYFAAARFVLASILLEETGLPLLCIDVDAVANQPIWEAYESWRAQGDVGLMFHDKAKVPWRRILASAVGLNATTAGNF
jgi:hypothetical protein